ncbi:Receptor-like kinase [Seminavis robusta]|uniref:Receptor-like kinase n=1 Tax=Seminavis robusta TaxID=568900 RepID=A0A9N8D7K6_9STRA|nr:Receptor-like kinase [Seminavis robusta]|eukprot:Sro21_g014900.1 Receptor-like kinase (940) ;mRNA; f:131665-134736
MEDNNKNGEESDESIKLKRERVPIASTYKAESGAMRSSPNRTLLITKTRSARDVMEQNEQTMLAQYPTEIITETHTIDSTISSITQNLPKESMYPSVAQDGIIDTGTGRDTSHMYPSSQEVDEAEADQQTLIASTHPAMERDNNREQQGSSGTGTGINWKSTSQEDEPANFHVADSNNVAHLSSNHRIIQSDTLQSQEDRILLKTNDIGNGISTAMVATNTPSETQPQTVATKKQAKVITPSRSIHLGGDNILSLEDRVYLKTHADARAPEPPQSGVDRAKGANPAKADGCIGHDEKDPELAACPHSKPSAQHDDLAPEKKKLEESLADGTVKQDDPATQPEQTQHPTGTGRRAVSVGLALAHSNNTGIITDEESGNNINNNNNNGVATGELRHTQEEGGDEEENQYLVEAMPVSPLQVAQQVSGDGQQSHRHHHGRAEGNFKSVLSDCPPWMAQVFAFLIILAVFVIVISIVVAAMIALNHEDTQQTSSQDERGIRIRNQLSQTLGDSFFKDHDESLPQTIAWHWLVYEDSMQLDDMAPNLLQRFLLAFFYITMTQEGPWRACNPPENETRTFSNSMDLCYYEAWVGDGLNKVGGLNIFPASFQEVLAMSWLTGHECQWAGVFCDPDDNVDAIHLDDMLLNGTLPSEIVHFSQLTSLSLTNNHLTGLLPPLEGLRELEYLDVQQNQFTGTIPSAWWSLSTLTHLNVEYNLMSVGSLPSEIGQLSNLEALLLSGAGVTGTVPTEVLTLPNLGWLILAFNSVAGTIPTEAGLLKKMEMLIFSKNPMSGTIPSEIATLPLLREFSTWGTQISGTIPTEFYSMETDSLSALILSECNLSGTLSSSLAQMTALGYFIVAKNPGIYGTIPTELGLMTGLERMYLQLTNLSGSMPNEICALRPSLENVRTDCDPLSNGTIPVFCPFGCCTKCCNRETQVCTNTAS